MRYQLPYRSGELRNYRPPMVSWLKNVRASIWFIWHFRNDRVQVRPDVFGRPGSIDGIL
jgi:hypothetical protein|nr:hypothetical protein [Croceibacterium selenioxidans]